MSLPTRLHNCEALILKYRNFREADRILTLLTPDLGKLDALARGARKARSRKAGHVEPFMHVALVLRKSKWLPEVSEVQVRHAFPQCRSTLELMTYASYACELVDNLAHPEEDADLNRRIYQLLFLMLQELDADPNQAPVLARWFDLQALGWAGFQPELFHCLACGQEAQPRPCFFSVSQGGMLCPSCGPVQQDALPLDLETFKFLRYWQTRDWPAVKTRKYRNAAVQSSAFLLGRYVSFTLERPLRAVRFARAVRQLDA